MERNTTENLDKLEYIDTAMFYDLGLTNNYYPDVKFYNNIISKHKPKNVLELGCGTGRVSLQLNLKHIENISCIDLSKNMLEVFRRKLKIIPSELKDRFTLYNKNMIDFELDKKFDCIIIPFRSFQCITKVEDVIKCLNNLKKHLAKNGILLINIYIPTQNFKELEGLSEKKVFFNGDDKVFKTVTNNSIDLINQIQQYTVEYEIEKTKKKIIESFKLRFYYPNEFITILTSNGLRVVETFEGFDLEGKVSNATNDLTVMCEKTIPNNVYKK